MTELDRGDLLLEVRELHTYFFTRDGVVPAVRGVSFEMRRGEILGLVGESGSGKSITARSVIGLVPRPGRVVAGNVRFKGRELTRLSHDELRRVRGAEIGMVLQEPMTSLNPVLRIGDQVAETLEYHSERLPRATTARDAAIEMLELVRIPDARRRASDYPVMFSGGMRQRVGIAIAAVTRPSLVIADEPTTALDVTIQAQVLDLLRELRDSLDVGVLLITHDLGVVAELCDTVAVMYAGKIVESADADSLFRHPQHPYTRLLLASIPRLGVRQTELPVIGGQPPDPESLPAGCPFHPRCPVAQEICMRVDPEPTAIPSKDGRGIVRCWVVADELAARNELSS